MFNPQPFDVASPALFGLLWYAASTINHVIELSRRESNNKLYDSFMIIVDVLTIYTLVASVIGLERAETLSITEVMLVAGLIIINILRHLHFTYVYVLYITKTTGKKEFEYISPILYAIMAISGNGVLGIYVAYSLN